MLSGPRLSLDALPACWLLLEGEPRSRLQALSGEKEKTSASVCETVCVLSCAETDLISERDGELRGTKGSGSHCRPHGALGRAVGIPRGKTFGEKQGERCVPRRGGRQTTHRAPHADERGWSGGRGLPIVRGQDAPLRWNRWEGDAGVPRGGAVVPPDVGGVERSARPSSGPGGSKMTVMT